MFSTAGPVRTHELHKYCNNLRLPIESHFDFCVAESLVLSGALTIFAEALTARLGACGAFVILTDGNTQYILAGSVKAQEHGFTNGRLLGHSDADSKIWLWLGQKALDLGLGTWSKRKRHLIILDASKHERLKVLSSVSGPPSLRFCAAAPITTKADIRIGYVLVVDTSDRQCLSDRQADSITFVAAQCMGQLDLARELELRRRGINMTEGLSSFLQRRPVVDQMLEEPPPFKPLAKTGSPQQQSPSTPASKDQRRRHIPDADTAIIAGNERKTGLTATGFAKLPPQSEGSATQRVYTILQNSKATTKGRPLSPMQTENNDNRKHDNNETPYRRIFRRAAEFLRTSLDVDGVMFVDGLVGFHGTLQPAAEPEQELEREMVQRPRGKPLHADTEHEDDTANSKHLDEFVASGLQETINPSTRTFTSAGYQKDVYTTKPAEIFGISMCSDRETPTFQWLSESTLGLDYVDEGFLQYLMDQNPDGKAWYFDENATPYCCQGDTLTLDEDPASDTGRLLQAFGGIRQLLFAPLTDPVDFKRLAGCFIWSTRVLPVLTSADLPSLETFLHTVEAEISRVDTMAALKQKESFVSSVSHELRSPLHGILGAVEVLLETGLDNAQQSLADTIVACGTTLYETLSSVLSYAKINEFERRRVNPRQNLPRLSPWSLENKGLEAARPDGGSDGLFVCANIAELCEEIVEVVQVGYLHSVSAVDERVTINLDIAFHQSWNFVTEAGALRRIMMNIIGNALKYTPEGVVGISLHVEHNNEAEVEKGSENTPKDIIVFTVTDSGKGMSNNFLENHLFVPFSQEDPAVSEGVGLGLSIVKSLVSLLGGEMKVKSQLGEGTEITVSIPMHLGDPKPQETTAATSTFERNVLVLRARNLKVATCSLPPNVERTLRTYLVQWFRCTVLAWDDRKAPFDIVFVGDTNNGLLAKMHIELQRDKQENKPAVIAIGPRKWAKSRRSSNEYISERCSEPLGPGKILKALLKCIGNGNRPSELESDSTSGRFADTAQRVTSTDVKALGTKNVNRDATSTSDHEATSDMMSADSAVAVAMTHPISSSVTRSRTVPDAESEDESPTTKLAASETHITHQAPISDGKGLPREGPGAVGSARLSQNCSPTILLVEDNPLNLRLLKTYLIKRGYRNIESAGNGLFAVQAVERRIEGFDIIIMDISMPEMDGFEATRLIRELESRRRSLPGSSPDSTGLSSIPPPIAPALILALTGLASAKDQARAFHSGVDVFMTKPLKFQELGSLLAQWERGDLKR